MLLLPGILEYGEGRWMEDDAGGNLVADPDEGCDMVLRVSDGREGCWRDDGPSEELVKDAVALGADPVGRAGSTT